tara:strand:- start:47 stop:310 length:264 start_codon:yes stop_codon:yes gene_type:complete
MSENKLKLQAKLEAKRIARLSYDNAVEKLEELEESVKTMREGPNKIKTKFLIEMLSQELDKIEDNAINMIHSGMRGGGGGGSGCDAG